MPNSAMFRNALWKRQIDIPRDCRSVVESPPEICRKLSTVCTHAFEGIGVVDGARHLCRRMKSIRESDFRELPVRARICESGFKKVTWNSVFVKRFFGQFEIGFRVCSYSVPARMACEDTRATQCQERPPRSMGPGWILAPKHRGTTVTWRVRTHSRIQLWGLSLLEPPSSAQRRFGQAPDV